MMNHLVIKAGLSLALDATGVAGDRCPDNAYPPCFGMRDALIYILLFTLIGLFTGLVSKRYLPNGEDTSYVANCILGIIGSFMGGAPWLIIRWISWNVTNIPEGSLYTFADNRHLLPGYLISLVAASITALFVIAVYRLIRAAIRSAL
jgi:uncharacterized membrane protein YeaQ/YmgE (transglycosylase-associated protein family)